MPNANPPPCAFCGGDDSEGSVQHCDVCDVAFHTHKPCSTAVLGKETFAVCGDIVCKTCDSKKPPEEGAGKEDDDESSGYSSSDSESNWFPKLDGCMPPRLTGLPDSFSPGVDRV